MLFELFKFEIKYRLKRSETYVFFTALLLYSLIAVEALFGNGTELIRANAPFIIAKTMGVTTAFFMAVVSMVMGVSVLRDFEHHMESLMFINPITKKAYLGGRFLGSFVVLLGIFSALLIGLIIGNFLPWKDPATLLPFHFWSYLQPFLTVVLPTIFFGGSLFFVTGALSRRIMVVYVQGILLLILYIFTLQLTAGSGNKQIIAILDPFSFQAIGGIVEFWTPAEKNTRIVPFEGILLYSRLLWIGIGMLSLIVGYYRFNFNVVTGKAGKKASTTNQSKASTTGASISIPSPAIRFDLQTAIRQLASHSWFHIRTILKESSFWAIAACAVATIFINSISLDIKYGVDSYPATYLIVSQLIELSVLFFLFIILFYSGELVWKERDANFHQVFDTVPVSSFISLTGKLLALLVILAFLLLSMMAAGMVFQAFNEYYIFEPGLYFMEFFTGIFFFLVLLSLVAFFFQSVLNNKYVAHIAMAVFLVVGIVVLNLSGYSHPLYSFGGGFLPMYSEMNSYGSFLKGYLWIKSYWLWFSIMLFASATLFIARGTETDFKQRWKSRRQRYTKPLGRLIAGAFLFFVFSGGYIFYNTNILSDFDFPSAEKVYKANYEKALKKFEHLPQPKITAVNLNVDLYPSERNFIAKGSFTLVNKHDQAIPEIHIQKAPSPDLTIERIEFERASEADNTYEEYGYFIHTLDTPLQPGDSLKMEFRQTYITQGLETGLNHDIVQNGTFFNNNYFPTLGYHPDIELEDKSEREEQGLKPRARRASINDPIALKQGMANDDGEEIRFEIVVSTDSSQTAIAPGYLESHWTEGDRSYFRYRTNQPITNFYSVTSADYKVVKDRWTPSANHSQDPVELEIYYQKGHEYNLKRMMKGLKKSLGYFNSHFSPYQYPQLRIMEFPRYRTFAQSFASTIPFSEAIGFMMDIDDEKDVDMAFAITAHEVAHQWWGHQVNPANVQGRSMISESLAQYSALMVLKKEFSDEKAHQFVQREMRRYLRGRSDEEQQEMPLALVESGQDYIHYGKGAVNMYALQDYISEDSVNLALKRFLRDWNNIDGLIKLRTDRYATTNDLIGYFREVTPDSLQYVLEDLFETITLHDIQAVSGSYESTASQQFEVNLEVDVTKLRLNKSGIEDTVEVHDWIDIGVYAEDKNGSQELIYLKKHKITEPLTNIEITVDRRPTKAGIDPLHKLIDREPDDNVIGLSGKEEGRESP